MCMVCVVWSALAKEGVCSVARLVGVRLARLVLLGVPPQRLDVARRQWTMRYAGPGVCRGSIEADCKTRCKIGDSVGRWPGVERWTCGSDDEASRCGASDWHAERATKSGQVSNDGGGDGGGGSERWRKSSSSRKVVVSEGGLNCWQSHPNASEG